MIFVRDLEKNLCESYIIHEYEMNEGRVTNFTSCPPLIMKQDAVRSLL